jgi:hypothetical protein
MPSALELGPSSVHLPLMRLGMCLDCEACFEIGVAACPACGSKTWMPLARFLETARRRRMVHSIDSLDVARGGSPRRSGNAHHLIVVARDRDALYQHFREAFAGNATITVILDRRHGDRRVATTNRAGERRRHAIDEQLRVLGWAIVRDGGSASPK